ncbi:arsenate reductase (glutaredoxin) [Ketobacter sp. MCCC 1A13808]|uniref:arsenate reductase (glutaredoxin) n=1 Tax=Ketobacter sp. MCCC 1A13808 TaxID=2602738 RepID=UPI000F1C89AC|nr:arsenate reductase (glutaredoxin) [Ketobacter sp. MCCC 1A13808]MVF10768.1 arsenate reductase (glutaredoxin) [Ketobacter sp. MCCC 1A13808]RLP56181.1 MAG: arsenate reductase (glutaredoxin) [Ketobacter sp.]
MTTTLYHNPRCSKSRETLKLLEDNGITPEIVLYLDNPPDAKALKSLLKKLNLKPRQLMRTKEAEYKAQGLGDESLTEAELIEAMVKTPKLIERPIFINGSKAALGRPPEQVLEIL